MENLLQAKIKECEQINANGTFSPGELFCEVMFDGLLCWGATKAGTVAVQPCPSYFVHHNVKENATKKCEENGEWFRHPKYNNKWTNYSRCFKLIDNETASIQLDSIDLNTGSIFESHPEWFTVIKQVSRFGYTVSLICLVIAFAIFASVKKLRCPRNKLHMHLFMSFIMRAFMSLLKDLLFVEGIALPSDVVFVDGKPESIKEHNIWTCKALTSARWYFVIANYTLILMEGIYLHNLMFFSVLSDNSRITVYYLLGWGLPLLFVVPWIILRAVYEDTMCWTTSENKYFSLLIHVPIAVSVIINFILFVIIVRILFVKLGSIYLQQKRIKYRRLARSTLILLLLFGVPYVFSLIILYCAPANDTLELIWLFFDQSFSAFQGFFVVLIYCLLNNEVHVEIKTKYYLIRRRQQLRKPKERTISTNSQYATFFPLQDDHISLNNHKKGDCKSNCTKL